MHDDCSDRETAWRPFAPKCKALSLILGLLLLSHHRSTQPAVAAGGSRLSRLRISIPGLGSSSYPLIMAQKKGYFRSEGYDVELIPMSGGLAVKTLMAAEVNLTQHAGMTDFGKVQILRSKLRGI
jgi:ABC-type nitrate/sulfonate/bicarbonate transport system substrate-binding protein